MSASKGRASTSRWSIIAITHSQVEWETITVDFITGLPHTKKQHDSIMVVLDKLSKTAHFIPIESTYKIVEITDIFMREISWLHGIPRVVISDIDVKFTSTFWKPLFARLGT